MSMWGRGASLADLYDQTGWVGLLCIGVGMFVVSAGVVGVFIFAAYLLSLAGPIGIAVFVTFGLTVLLARLITWGRR